MSEQDEWGSHASDYAEKASSGPQIESVNGILAALDALLPFEKATAILDNGCGTGIGIKALIDDYSARLPDSVRLMAADLSPGMVDVVRKVKTENRGNRFWDALEFDVWGIEKMSGAKGSSFSHIIASLVMFFSPRPEDAFSEAYRVLKPDGAIAMTSFQKNGWIELCDVIGKIRPDLKMPSLPAEWASEDWIRGQFEKAGFRDVVIKPVHVSKDIDDPQEFAEFLVKTNNPVVSPILNLFTAEEKKKAVDMIVSEIRRVNPGSSPKISNVLLLSSARK
ncbi:LAME_0A08020g1_1 [Lachancea meyersii CBS 8951]|uniref:LAME_0A08020g1_1 n=1 Tax=Lachancea meyersii CBS 8951 TaxID=1266667 RepID=A0A1G4IRK8_9SACH|nr:LAME_0A08020g1_1 [Lachancea meyersii CBS 8951]